MDEVAGGAVGGAASGAAMGAMVGGPVGAVIGGGVGLLAGGISGMGAKKSRKAQEAAMRAQMELIHQQQVQRAKGIAKARDTFGDVWSLSDKGKGGDDTSVRYHRDAALALANRGNLTGAIESEASAARDTGEAALSGQAQEQAKALRGNIATRGLLGSSMDASMREGMLADYGVARANLAGGVEATRAGAWNNIQQRQLSLEGLASGGGNPSAAINATKTQGLIAGARAQMPSVFFGNLINTGVGMLNEGALASAQGGQGMGAIGLPSLNLGGTGAQGRPTGVATATSKGTR